MKKSHNFARIISQFYNISLIAAAIIVALCCGCESNNNEPDDWNWNWDEEYELPEMFAGDPYLRPYYVLDVVMYGTRHKFDDATKTLLKEAAEKPGKYPLHIKTSTFGELKKVIGNKALEIDELYVNGPLNEDDLTYIKRCIAAGNLRKVDLSNAQLQNNTIHSDALCLYEYPLDGVLEYAYLPLLSLELPDGVILKSSALRNTMLTSIDLSGVKELGSTCFTNTPLLSGNLVIPATIEEIGYGAFAYAGDGELVVNYHNKIMPTGIFTGAFIKEINIGGEVSEINGLNGVNGLKSLIVPSTVKTVGKYGIAENPDLESLTLSEGLEVIDEYGMWKNPKLTSLTLPSTLKSIKKMALAENTALMSLTVKFTDPAVAAGPISIDELMAYQGSEIATAFGYIESPIHFADGINVYVPASSYDSFKNAVNWFMWFDNFKSI